MAGACLLPLAISAPSAASDAVTAETAFAAPTGPMVLTRTVRRSLADGAQIVTRRVYSVKFSRRDAGYAVSGTLVQSEVEAPRSLGVLAELERKRDDSGLFPVLLDGNGMLTSGGGGNRAASIGEAIAAATSALDSSGLPAMDLAQAKAFMNRFHQGSAQSAWPADLFHPRSGRRDQTESVALPDGSKGRVNIVTECRVIADTGLLDTLSRTITTELGKDTRVTVEIWTLAMQPGRP